MDAVDSLATWDVLEAIGFVPDEKAIVKPSLFFPLGNLKLSAFCGTNRWFKEVVLFGGILSTPRTAAEIQFEMPLKVTSDKQCAAWIVWHLDKASSDGIFTPARATAWVEEGRQNFALLPWMAELAAYNARPTCTVQRDWLRVALKNLREQIALADEEAEVIFSFDGQLLIIRCAEGVVALPGEGTPWTNRYRLPARNLRNLPKRIMKDVVEVSVWGERLQIGRNSYTGVLV